MIWPAVKWFNHNLQSEKNLYIFKTSSRVLGTNIFQRFIGKGRTVHTHTHTHTQTHTPQVRNYAAKHRPSKRQNICESPQVISVKHSYVLPDDESHKIRNMSEWFLIWCPLKFYTTQTLTSKFYITECIIRIIKVIDYNIVRWKPEITQNIFLHTSTSEVKPAWLGQQCQQQERRPYLNTLNAHETGTMWEINIVIFSTKRNVEI
jgi:hypothetical protein